MTTIAARRVQSIAGPAISAVALLACVWFAVQFATVVGAWSPEVTVAGPRAPVIEAAPAPVVAVEPAPDGEALVARNMFCARCTGLRPAGDGGGPVPDGAPRFTARLIATHVEDGTHGRATLSDPVTGAAGSFAIGAIAPGGAVIVAVRRGSIDVRFPDEAIETVRLAPEVAGMMGPPGKVAAVPAAPASAWGDRVRALGDDRFAVDRTLIGELVGAGTASAVPGVRLAPVMTDGNLSGIRVAAARTGSLARTLGLEPGDVIEAIDGQRITSPTMLMDLYGRIDQLAQVALTVRRKGGSRPLTYELH